MSSNETAETKEAVVKEIIEEVKRDLKLELYNSLTNENIDDNKTNFIDRLRNNPNINTVQANLINIIKNRLRVLARRKARESDDKIPLLVSSDLFSATIISNSKRLGLQKINKVYSLLNDIDDKLLSNDFIDKALDRIDVRLKKYLSIEGESKAMSISDKINQLYNTNQLFDENAEN